MNAMILGGLGLALLVIALLFTLIGYFICTRLAKSSFELWQMIIALLGLAVMASGWVGLFLYVKSFVLPVLA